MIGVIIGHTLKNQGMRVYNGMTEFQFNSLVANHLSLAGIPVFIRHEPGTHTQSYNQFAKRVASYPAITQTIELHLNAFDSRVTTLGMETLVLKDSIKSNTLAHRIEQGMHQIYDIKIRPRVKVSERGRGWYNLFAMEREGIEASVILEPCFADKRHVDSVKIIENPIQYAHTIAEIIKSA